MKKPRSSAVFFTSITEDIAMDILLKLPVKPLLRFKCLSKSWYSLISDPSFIKLHLQYSNNNQKLIVPISYPNNFISQYSNNHQKLDLHLYVLLSREEIALPHEYIEQHHPELCEATILCSCDGLLLLRCSYGATEHIFVWNPLTRESRELPKVNNCDDAPPTTDYILGYDSSTDDYNVMRDGYSRTYVVGCSVFLRQRVLMVFSLKKSSSWRKIKDFKYRIKLENCMYLNGALHWLQCPDKDKILCFSLAQETIMEMELPNNDAEIMRGLKLGICQGFICLTETIASQTISLNVWLMKEYGSWTKIITIPKLPLNDDPLRRAISAPYHFINNNKAIFIIKLAVDSTMVMNDLEKKEFEIGDWHKLKRSPYLDLAFVESLVSPNCIANSS